MQLTWEHTVIGGQTAPYDYTARDGDVLVGRVMRVEHGPGAGEWMWSMVARVGWGRSDITTHGREATKQAAADLVREVYESCLRLRQARGPL